MQDKATHLRSKNVTTNTFREMDGSGKSIILLSESLGLSAGDVVKIKAAIEEKTHMRADA